MTFFFFSFFGGREGEGCFVFEKGVLFALFFGHKSLHEKKKQKEKEKLEK